MKKVKYYYNPGSLRYEKIEEKFWKKALRGLSFLVSSILFSLVFVFLAYSYLDSPKEKQLKREIEKLKFEYEVMNKKMEQLDKVMAGLQERDDNIYRVIFESEPIPNSIREAGTGGSYKYKDLERFSNSDLMIATAQKLDRLSKKLYIQSKSYDEITQMIINKAKMLSSIPSIQPIANKDLKQVASGYGYRIHPIYKTRRMHTGIDFTAPTGTDIYCTGDGKVVEVEISGRGYGNYVVVDHGFGYKTLYAHLHKIKVRLGQKVNRGDVIGLVGNTGTSTGPHLHYEVIRSGQAVNPINFFYNDLTPEEYEKMIELSSSHNQSFD